MSSCEDTRWVLLLQLLLQLLLLSLLLQLLLLRLVASLYVTTGEERIYLASPRAAAAANGVAAAAAAASLLLLLPLLRLWVPLAAAAKCNKFISRTAAKTV